MSRSFFLSVALLLSQIAPSVAQEIVLGQSVALTGPAQELGKEMVLGAKTYFDIINAAGGVRGKKIVLRALGDGYEPPRAEANTKKFVEDGDVLALFGYGGTPTSAASIPVAIKATVPFLGAFTGAELLRTTMNRYVFNVRAGHFDETEAIVRQMTQGGVTRIGVFRQNDSYGQAGLAGGERALNNRQALGGRQGRGGAQFDRRCGSSGDDARGQTRGDHYGQHLQFVRRIHQAGQDQRLSDALC